MPTAVGKVEYFAMTKVAVQTHDINLGFPFVKSCRLEPRVRDEPFNDAGLAITVTTDGLYRGDPDLETLTERVRDLCAFLSHQLVESIRPLAFPICDLPHRPGWRSGQSEAAYASITIPPRGPIESALTRACMERLDRASERGKVYVRQFSAAVAQEHPVAKFSFLYNLALELCGDKQASVDAEICRVDPGCPLSVKPQRKRKLKGNVEQETVYTRLRNELSHRRPGTTIGSTSNEIAIRMGRFQRIVKQMMEARFPTLK